MDAADMGDMAADFGELEQIPQIPQSRVIILDTGWRWEVKGSGRYKGQYYNWRWGSGKSRKYRNGGKLAEARDTLPARTGKGNRKPRHIDSDFATVGAGMAGGGASSRV